MNMPLPVFHVILRVRPVPNHGRYWEVQFGYLHIWIGAVDSNDAGQRATAIAEMLPFEIVGSKLEVLRDNTAGDPEMQPHHEDVRNIGLSLLLVACKTGTEEEDFATSLGDDEP